MTPGELRRGLRQQKKELRRSVARMKREARARVARVPSVRREQRRRRIRRAVTLALLLLLALLIRCECGPTPLAPPPEPVVAIPPVVKPKVPAPRASKPKAFDARTERQRRGNYQNGAQTPPGWLDDFRLQVAARSPRLAQCFQGTDRPGVLRWTTAVNATSGVVSDPVLEHVGTGGEPNGTQRDCVLGVLSSPGYRLTPGQGRDLPERVSILIEF